MNIHRTPLQTFPSQQAGASARASAQPQTGTTPVEGHVPRAHPSPHGVIFVDLTVDPSAQEEHAQMYPSHTHQQQVAMPFVLQMPRTVADVDAAVRCAGEAFGDLYVRDDWVGAAAVLKTLGETMALLRLPATEGKALSALEDAALKHLGLFNRICMAFAMGACHYHNGAPYDSPWNGGLRFQAAGDPVSTHRLVEHYAADSRLPASRAEALAAALVHLSWLAPTWHPDGGPPKQEIDGQVLNALWHLSDALTSVYATLAQHEKAAFLNDLLSAVTPAYCSPLLASGIAQLPVFALCGGYLKLHLDAIQAGPGAALFPMQSNSAKGHHPAGPQSDQGQPGGTGEKRRRGSDLEEAADRDRHQQRPRTASAPETGSSAPAIRTWVIPDMGAAAQPMGKVPDVLANNNSNSNSSNAVFAAPYLPPYVVPDSVSPDMPLILKTPLTKKEVGAAVKKARTAFRDRGEKGDWDGVSQSLRVLGESMASIPKPLELVALNKLKYLDPYDPADSAFLMGSCHYYGPGSYSGSWPSGLRFQSANSTCTMVKVVEHYALSFGSTESRTRAFKAVLVHLGWLAPNWVNLGGRNPMGLQKQRLGLAFQALSTELMKVHDKFVSPLDKHDFLKDLLSAVSPTYCSPLLVSWIAASPAFRACGDGLATRLAEIKARNGLGLFPLNPRLMKDERWGKGVFGSFEWQAVPFGESVDAHNGSNTNTNTNTVFVDPDPPQMHEPQMHVPEAIGRQALDRLTRVQRTREHESFLSDDRAPAPEPARTPPPGTDAPITDDPEPLADWFDVIWG
ncbi:hypothetical protein [Hydrogenophaga sp. BPS33]|uniref:hypothetical protein n=1 Tax=Hydrogenophaga sp. BPS33 TaxID=2651974 RepID=UPI00131FAFC3|nr:hypothetical protein [Hydrogenophaga sp. BPS33]QHE85386.1 hypothetical protein F9K07_10985 [Hydrogenophaga sp. BPS33]